MITGQEVKWFEEVDVKWGPRGYRHNISLLVFSIFFTIKIICNAFTVEINLK